MSDGTNLIGGKTASSWTLRNSSAMDTISRPQVGAIMCTRRDGGQKGHVGLVVAVNGNQYTTIEGNTGGGNGKVAYRTHTIGSGNQELFKMPRYGALGSQNVIKAAEKQVGYAAGNGSKTPYGAFTGADGQAWCASFISWCFDQAYGGVGEVPSYGNGSGDYPYSDYSGWDENGNYIGAGAGFGIGKGGMEFHGHIWGNSDLVTYYGRLSNGAYFPRENRASHITVHNAFAEADIMTLAAMAEASGKCYNYGVDASGVIGLFADEQMWTMSSDNDEADMFGINIIVSGGGGGFSGGALLALTDLLEDVFRRNFLYLVTYNDNVDDTLTNHSMYNPAVDCPGAAAEMQLRMIADEVNNRLSAKIQTNFVQVGSRLASSMSNALRTQSIINIANINPYVVIVKSSADPASVDTNILLQSGVVAAFIDIGSYSKDHGWNTNDVYDMVDRIWFDNIYLNFGYIFKSKANDVEELREEAYWLHFIVSKYAPKLGIWLEPAFKNTKEAPGLVEAWYDFFVDWGLKSKCGLYCTMEEIDDIGWPAQSNYMALWLAGEMTDAVCPDDELLTPTFFQLGNLTNYGINTAAQAYWRSQAMGYDVTGTGSYWAPGPTDVYDENGTVYDGQLIIQGGDGSFVVKDVPQIMNGTPFKKYEGYAAITSQSSLQWKIQHSSSVTTDSQGFRRYGDRYIIAVGSAIADVGQYVDVKLQNGQTIKCIVGDRKADQHTDSQNIYTRGTNPCCSEFIVDTKKLDPAAKKAGNCSKTSGKNWDSPVVSFTVHNTYVSV